MLTVPELETLLARLPNARVGVIGDFCLDVYWLIDMQASAISVETGKPTHPVREQRYSLGGAGNVVANLKAIGVGALAVFGVVGRDPFGESMAGLLRGLGVDCSGLLFAPAPTAWQTLTYCKPYIGDEELSRLDMGNFNRLPDSLAAELLAKLEQRLAELDVVVVNQQVQAGIHVPALRAGLDALMRRYPRQVFVFDGRHYLDSYPLAWLKINAHEALKLCGVEKDPLQMALREETLDAAARLFARTRKPVFVTRGGRGCIVQTAAGATEIPGLLVVGPTDPVGAGDSFLSGLSAGLAVGAAPAEAAQIGNFAARVTVAKLKQTGAATPDEILAIARGSAYIHEPELADDPRRARYWQHTRIELVRDVPRDLRLAHAILDHDGTISTLRQGWEEVMEPVMVRAVLGARYDSADEGLYQKVVGRVRRHIDQTTGVQTLVQMQGLVELVREFGIVPEHEVLDMHGYKAIYNDALMTMVRARMARLKKNELSVNDFVLKNAVELLRALNRAGVKLYLASGTDQADVEAEADALGYAALFEGRIYGAVGDVAKEAKRMVLERILGDIGDITRQVVTFGDGPVEIRETRVRGGLAVGVASDEVRRFDLNPAKRSRLIRAGASVIVPDYSQLNELLRFLGVAAGA
jgi:bifunctional ADP-heptose synthase (sugar kinase/adenylyltransferase)/phosphoglycolate phosphatase-like HAD superfamily hydrolase